MLVRQAAEGVVVPRRGELPGHEEGLALGSWRDEPVVALEVAPGTALAAGLEARGLRVLWSDLDEAVWALAGRAFQLVEWQRTHRFCGRCGHATEARTDEHVRVCPACGQLHFPRVSPAVIFLVHKGSEMLLARSPRFAPEVFSTLAGFVEPGETLEQTVAREAAEEVGITLGEVRYFGSQPWPFPHSLMVGFYAAWQEGELRPDGVEIEAAAWFTADRLPRLPSRYSIAWQLVQAFLDHGGPPPGP